MDVDLAPPPVGRDARGRPFRRLFEPLTIGGFTIRNRIVNTSHGTGLGDERDLRYLQERARGGAGLLGVNAGFGVANVVLGPGPVAPTPAWDDRPPSPSPRRRCRRHGRHGAGAHRRS